MGCAKAVDGITGGVANAVTGGKFATPVADIAATIAGVPEFIPLINAGITTSQNLSRGQSIGKSLGQGAISGGTALAGQELAGAFGIGQGNTAFNEALGITGDNPAGTGLPNLANIFGGTGAGGDSISPPNSTNTLSPSSPLNTPSAPVSGGSGIGAAGAAAPSGAAGGGDILSGSTQLNSDFIDKIASGGGASGDLSSVGSSATTGSNIGTGNFGTPNLPINLSSGGGLTSEFAKAAGLPGASLNSPGIDSAVAGLGVQGGETPSSLRQFIDSPSFKNAGNIITSNPGAALSAGGLGLEAIKGTHETGAEKNLKAQAGQLSSQGQKLQGYLDSGTLPPGLQHGVDQAANSAKASIRSKYASMGMSGSSAEQQDLAAVDQRAQAQGAQMAMQLLQTGISESGMSSQLYQAILGQSLADDKELSSAISGFASAAGGGGQAGRGGITVNYG